MTEEQMIKRYAVLSAKSHINGGWKRAGRRIYSAVCNVCSDVYFTLIEKSEGYCSNKCHAKVQPVNAPKASRDRYVDWHGYVKVRAYGHPKASKYGRHVLEHVLVMEKHLGRYLRPGENVHHKNGDRKLNELSNLELWYRAQTPGQRVGDLVEFVFNNYNSEIRAKIEVQDLLRSVLKTLTEKGTLAVVGTSSQKENQ